VRVLLVDPPNHYLRSLMSSVQVHPLGIGYLAGYLAADHDVTQLVCDIRPRERDDEDAWDVIATAIEQARPDVVGISTVTATFPAGLVVARLAKQRLGKDVTVVMGGVHSTFRPEDAFREPAIDYVVKGEGERTMGELLARLEAGDSPVGVAGLLWRDDGGAIVHGPPRAPIADLDELPFPKRDGILWDDFIEPGFYQSIITVRGCPYKCIYCSVPNTSDRKTRYRSATNVADEVQLLVEHHGIPYLFYHDSVFTLNRKRTVALCDELRQRDIHVPFALQTRADRVDAELLTMLREAGCHQIFYGIESGDLETLRLMKKKMPLETIREAVAMTKDLDIRCTGFFMVGFPWETEAHIQRTASFATELGLDAISLFSATPLPGTELWDITDEGVIPDSIDFRTPQVNLTSLEPQRYAELFRDVKARVDAYNVDQMTGAMGHWPRG